MSTIGYSRRDYGSQGYCISWSRVVGITVAMLTVGHCAGARTVSARDQAHCNGRRADEQRESRADVSGLLKVFAAKLLGPREGHEGARDSAKEREQRSHGTSNHGMRKSQRDRRCGKLQPDLSNGSSDTWSSSGDATTSTSLDTVRSAR